VDETAFPDGAKTMNEIDEAVARFEGGCSCSQAVFAPFAEQLGVDQETAMKIACGFGGGMGLMGDTCGAVSGAFMVLGLRHGGQDSAAKDATNAQIREFARRFKEKHKSLDCRDLVACNLLTDEGRQKMKEEGLRKKVCSGLVRDAAEILEQMT
jgi:C_GCAxxG_C_C family probable redox protein